MFTCEFTHNGKRRTLTTSADDEKTARIAFANVKKRANGPFIIHDETIKQHASAAEMEAEIERFRVAQGKAPKPTEAELRDNALEVLDTAPAKGSNGEDDIWW